MAKVIVFQEILLSSPEIKSALESKNAEIIPAASGRDVLDLASRLKPFLLVIDTAMPQVSGIEVLRNVKELGDAAPKVVVVSSIDSTMLAQRAEDSGCDYFCFSNKSLEPLMVWLDQIVPLSEAKSEEWSSQEESPQRAIVSEKTESSKIEEGEKILEANQERIRFGRVSLAGPFLFEMEGEPGDKRKGEFLNASASGCLFASEMDLSLGKNIRIEFTGSDEQVYSILGKVARTAGLKRDDEFRFGIGIKFLPADEADQRAIEILIATKSRRNIQIPPQFMRKLVDAVPGTLEPFILGKSRDEMIEDIIGDYTSYEVRSFESQGDLFDCTRRMVLYRTKLNAFFFFVPTMQANKGTLAAPFLPLLKPLLEQCEQIEDELDALLVGLPQDDPMHEERPHINKTATSLHQSRLRLLFALDEGLTPEGLEENLKEFLVKVHSDVEHYRALKETPADDVRYSRKDKPKPPEEKKKRRPKKTLKEQKGALIILGIMIVLIGGIAFASYLSSRVSQTQLEIALPIVKAKKTEDGLEVFTTVQGWEAMPANERQLVIKKIEEFLTKENLRQLKLFTEDGKIRAAILSAQMGRNRVFQSRIWP